MLTFLQDANSSLEWWKLALSALSPFILWYLGKFAIGKVSKLEVIQKILGKEKSEIELYKDIKAWAVGLSAENTQLLKDKKNFEIQIHTKELENASLTGRIMQAEKDRDTVLEANRIASEKIASLENTVKNKEIKIEQLQGTETFLRTQMKELDKQKDSLNGTIEAQGLKIAELESHITNANL